MADPEVLARFRHVLASEAAAITEVLASLDAQTSALTASVARIVSACGEGHPGRLIATGVGKAGFVARKIAATFASTGTPSLFLHPTEARHGDLGMVAAQDVVLAFSNSGASEEVVALLPSLRHIGVAVIAIVGDTTSPLARHADHVLSIGRVIEACPLGLAPSTSTTAMLALGDALALTVLEQRRFTPEHYARFHPGGALGRKLTTCGEVMRTGERVAIAAPGVTVLDAMRLISRARTGSAIIVDADGRMSGIFTDGDLRRRLAEAIDPAALLRQAVATVATSPGLRIAHNELVESALRLCAQRKINELPVVDGDQRPLGIVDVQDLADRGFAV